MSNAGSYQVLRSSTNQLADATVVATAPGLVTVAAAPAVPSGTVVYYWVRAVAGPFTVCAGGTGPASGPVQAVGPRLPAPPRPVTAAGCGVVNISWDPVPGATGYRVSWIRDAPNFNPGSAEVAAGTTSYTLTSAPGALVYQVKVTPLGECGDGQTSLDGITQSPQAPITSVDLASMIQVIDCTTVKIAGIGQNEARITRQTPGQPDVLLADWTKLGQVYILDSVLSGVQHTYVVQTRNACGTGPTVQYAVTTSPPTLGSGGVVRTARGQTAVLQATVPLLLTGYTYQWRRGVFSDGTGGVPMTDGGRISGATTPRLVIASPGPEDTDYYALTATRGGCTAIPAVMPLLVIVPCAADFDGSGARTIDDIFVFLNAWFAGCP